MGGMKRVLGALATAGGDYLIQKGEAQEKSRLADTLYRRELALKDVESANRTREADAALGRAKELSSHTAQEQRVTSAAEGTVRKELQQGDQQFRERLANIEQRNRVALEKVQHSYRLSEAQADDARRQADEARAAGTYIDRYEVSADGRMVGFTKTGKRLATGAAGEFTPKSAGEGGGDSVDSFRPGGAPRGKPAEQTKPQPEKKSAQAWSEQDENTFRTRYTNATPQTAPGLFRGGKKMPMDEARSMLRGQ